MLNEQPLDVMPDVETFLEPEITEAELDAAIVRAWEAVKPVFTELGRLLYEMHTLKAQRGRNGGFTAYLRERTIPRSTAYDLMNRYAEENGLPPKGKRLPEVEDDEDGNRTEPYDSQPDPRDGWIAEETDLEAELREIEERQEADRAAKAKEEITNQAEDRLKKAQEEEQKTGKTAPLHILLHLSLDDKKICKQVYNDLGPDRATEVVYLALLKARQEMAVANAQA